MSKPELDLVRIGKLKLEPARRTDFEGMVRLLIVFQLKAC